MRYVNVKLPAATLVTKSVLWLRHLPRASPTSPMTAAITPAASIYIALSVGEPVKTREMSELSEFDALTPKTMSKIPTAIHA